LVFDDSSLVILLSKITPPSLAPAGRSRADGDEPCEAGDAAKAELCIKNKSVILSISKALPPALRELWAGRAVFFKVVKLSPIQLI
ncbi:unnamed protein product, partial [Mycena citricolor]